MSRRRVQDFSSRDISRLSAFSDAIFAIALTLPILELRFPSASHSLVSQLPELWPAFVAYLVTFFVGVRQWGIHFNLFDSVTEVDESAVNRNALYLFLFSLLPFTTSTIMLHGSEPLAVIFYGLNLAALSFVHVWLEAWLLKRDFVISEKVQRIRRGMGLSAGVGILFVVQALIGLVRPRWALFVPFALPLVYLVVSRISPLDD